MPDEAVKPDRQRPHDEGEEEKCKSSFSYRLSDPEVLKAADEARDIFAALEAKPFLERLDAVASR